MEAENPARAISQKFRLRCQPPAALQSLAPWRRRHSPAGGRRNTGAAAALGYMPYREKSMMVQRAAAVAAGPAFKNTQGDQKPGAALPAPFQNLGSPEEKNKLATRRRRCRHCFV